MIRKWIAKFTISMAERVVAPRYKHAVPIKLSFEPNKSNNKSDAPPKTLYITGETLDLSSSGIGFIVTSIRVKEIYLVGENRLLNVELDLPNGKVSMKVIGRRYEQVGIHVSTARYLINARNNCRLPGFQRLFLRCLRLLNIAPSKRVFRPAHIFAR